MATSIRLSPELQARASVFAGQLGISLNALIAVALRDYLDHRAADPAGEARGSQTPGAGPTPGSEKDTSIELPPPKSKTQLKRERRRKLGRVR